MNPEIENEENELWIEAVGETFEQLRIESGSKSYADFASEHGLDRSHYGRMEKGNNSRELTRWKIIKKHGISASEFYSRVQANYEKKGKGKTK